MYQKYFKRLLDTVLSLILLSLLFPIMTIIFFIVWYSIGFPIFKQKRPGLNNKIFTIYKFKTLYDLPKKNRQSKIGNFLRKTGLDELPQLLNVLKNNMSIVGPRPLLVEYLEKFTIYEKKRHLVKPGITGLAQVNADTSGLKNWEKSIKLDIYYVNNITFFMDIKILFKTFILVIFKKKQFQDFRKFYEK